MKSIINNKGVETKIFAETLEFEAYDQIKKMVNFEAYENSKVRIMNDAHSGKGCTVGTTIQLKDKVTPNLVGVDIGCFTGDTKIPLINGTVKTLKELHEINQEFWVYSMNKNNMIVAGKAIALKTKKNAELVKVTISGGYEILCTPDHKFMLRNGDYKEAKYLVYKDSLMPLYRTYQTRDGYESVLQPSKETKTKPTHIIVAEQMFGEIPKGYVVHHKNENQFDNTPENLELLTITEHSKLHGKKPMVVERLKSEEFKSNRIEKLNNNGFYDIKFTEKKKEIAIKNIKNYMENNPEKFNDDIKDNGTRGKKYLIDYNKSEKGREKSKEISNRLLKCDICGTVIKSPIGLYNHKKKEHNNHKVVSVEKLNYTEDVYCLNVDDYHNFALLAGVFVHNCGMLTVKLKNKEIDFQKLDEIIKTKVPSGFNTHDKPKKKFDFSLLRCKKHVDLERASLSIGSLGGGNHFIEVSKLDDDYYLIIHTGSRKLGVMFVNIIKIKLPRMPMR